MKRYKVTRFFIDGERSIFKYPENDKISSIKEDIKKSLISRYGENSFEDKFLRYKLLDKPSISIISDHTFLLEDVCNSYIHGDLYSSLTGACCLGERIFNDILFKVMNDFKSSIHFKEIHNKQSINNWEKAIQILSDWEIIDNETKIQYVKLYHLRTESVHFQSKSQDLNVMSLSAINIVNNLINKLFTISLHRKDILLYFDVPGEIFLKKEAEINPMVKAFFLPCSILVGPYYEIKSGDIPGSFKIIDDNVYDNIEISDLQFVKLRNEFKSNIK